jgi:hypothetical protein
MAEEEGWIGVKIVDKTLVGADGMVSNSLSEKDLKEIAFSLNAKYKIFPLTSFAKMVKLTRKTI